MGYSDFAAHDPSVGVRRRHLPFADSAKGRKVLSVPKLVAEPDAAAVQHLAALQGHGLDWGRYARVLVAGVEDGWRPLGAIDGRKNGKTDFIDKARPKESAVRAAAAFQQQALDPEFPVQDLQRQREIDLVLAGEDVGHLLGAKTREMGIRDLLRQHHDDGIAADVGAAPGDLAVPIESDSPGSRVAPGEPVFAWKRLDSLRRIRLPLAEFAAGHAADQPGIALELVVQALEQASRVGALRPHAAPQDAAVDTRDHVADHVRLHGCPL